MPSDGPAKNAGYDVVVVGSGAAGLATAVTAATEGLKVAVIEKAPVFGGTTALSGGYLWIPGHPKSGALGPTDELSTAREYLRHETANFFDAARVDAFLTKGREMVEYFEAHTEVRFLDAPTFSDYHPDAPGGRPGGRSILTAPINGKALGDEIRRLRHPLETITFVGMMFNSSQEVNHFFNVTRSPRSAMHVAKRLVAHGRDLALHGRGMRLTSGNALVARLALSCFRVGVPIFTDTAAQQLVTDSAGRVVGIDAEWDGRTVRLNARRGVVLACGGFPQDAVRRSQLFRHAGGGAHHLSPAPQGNTGDGLRLAEAVGGIVEDQLPNSAAWIPVSRIPGKDGRHKVFPHLIDRYKPGVIAVGPDGRRFVNEANSYHDFGQAMIARYGDAAPLHAWLLCDHRTLRKYGLGYVKPFPLPLGGHLRSGYLHRGDSAEALAAAIGVEPPALRETFDAWNGSARAGRDPAFRKGETAYNRFLGDANHTPNPCVAPLDRPPFYAIRLELGDLGTFAGLRTDADSRVLDADGEPIAGLLAVGNDAQSVMGGAYPGGGITLGPALTFGYTAGRFLAS